MSALNSDVLEGALGHRLNTWDDLYALRESEVHVVGAGSVEGAHLLLFLLDHGFKRLVGHDFSDPDGFARAFKRVHVGWPVAERQTMLERLLAGVEMRYRAGYLDGIEDADAIGVTQAWYLYDSNAPLLASPLLRARFFSLVQLYMALAPGRVVGVSGSQGKSTTTHLLGEMLEAGGLRVISAGNDRHGRQALDHLEEADPETILLLEISNRHLKMLDRSPAVAVLTNVFPNHLEEHGGLEGYIEAKARLVARQRPGDIAVMNADLSVTRDIARRTAAEVAWFGHQAGTAPTAPGVRVEAGRLLAVGLDTALDLDLDTFRLDGDHNAGNLAAAATTALLLGVSEAAIRGAASRARGLKHRVQFTWEAGGVRFYDDLNSTTPTATIVALRTLRERVIWIFGGDDKGLAPEQLPAVAADAVKLAIALPGPGTEALLPALEQAGVVIERMDTLGGAVTRAVEVGVTGDVVLLSPACPGFFTRHYVGVDEDTGFKHMVREATLGPATSPPARKPQT
ncbi:MAG: UDP-N-acetylmuramoyl-L-alanine--D-glutamate ligase [Candidatus Dormibacteria bacterium]